jgi:RNA polymerase sigma factor (sigma-70 family)
VRRTGLQACKKVLGLPTRLTSVGLFYFAGVQLDENEVYAAYREATGDDKERLETQLIQLLRKHAHALVYLKLHEHREDLVNYAVWLAIRDHESYEGRNGARFSTWFHHVVIRVCQMSLRSKERQREVSLEDVPEPSTPGADTADRQIELGRLFEEHLSAEEKELVRLRLAGADSQEIADQLGVAPSTVRVRFARLRDRLAEAVSEGERGT